MKKIISIYVFALLMLLIDASVFAQTLTETQMRNARATGYAIVAARNPGQNFTIYMIPWDGVNTLEYNANTQINSGWHAQAAIKGNYFTQTFNGSDFSQYSSVILNQQDFDTYKSTGTQWWIVCSTLSSFSGSINASVTGNVGIGTTTPELANHIVGGYGFPATSGTSQVGILRLQGTGSNGVLDFSVNGGLGATLQVSNRTNLTLNYPLILNPNGGNVGIGTTTVDYKLTVNGKIKAEEVQVVVDVPADYVFEKDYSLMPLTEVEKFVTENKHLPGMPDAQSLIANGWQVGEMNNRLLEKVEELTLYIIEQNKRIETLEKKLSNSIKN